MTPVTNGSWKLYSWVLVKLTFRFYVWDLRGHKPSTNVDEVVSSCVICAQVFCSHWNMKMRLVTFIAWKCTRWLNHQFIMVYVWMCTSAACSTADFQKIFSTFGSKQLPSYKKYVIIIIAVRLLVPCQTRLTASLHKLAEEPRFAHDLCFIVHFIFFYIVNCLLCISYCVFFYCILGLLFSFVHVYLSYFTNPASWLPHWNERLSCLVQPIRAKLRCGTNVIPWQFCVSVQCALPTRSQFLSPHRSHSGHNFHTC